MKIRCRKCRLLKAIDDFYADRHNSGGRQFRCKVCVTARMKEIYRGKTAGEKSLLRERQARWVREHPEKVKEMRKRNLWKFRLQMLAHYSKGEPICACCGEAEPRFLTIDHINGGGNRQKKRLKIGNFAQWLRLQGYPSGYQVLCYNCNCSKGFYSLCPHKTQK